MFIHRQPNSQSRFAKNSFGGGNICGVGLYLSGPILYSCCWCLMMQIPPFDDIRQVVMEGDSSGEADQTPTGQQEQRFNHAKSDRSANLGAQYHA